jgi:sarcosine oxidase subunit alpha
MANMRISQPQSGEIIDRSSPRSFTWNRKSHSGLAGDTIVSALAASGVRVFSRSLKYHAKRGILTANYLDPNTMIQVGDEPNVRGGHRPLQDGMVVTSQNTWPSLGFDAKAANKFVGRFLSPGFYYKTFIAPRALWPAYSKVLRRFAAGGTVENVLPPERYDKRHAHPDVVVAGAGPSGMGAAIAAAEAGATVLLVEEEHALGGHLRYGNDADRAAAQELIVRVEANPNIEVITDSVVSGRYDHNWMMINQRTIGHVRERLIKARAKTLVVAAGTIERPYVFEGNDLPGVMLSGAARRLINLYGVKPGTQAVVFTGNDEGVAAAVDLERAGVEVLGLVDARDGGELVRAMGRGGVSSVEIGGGKKVKADLLVTSVGWTTPTSLLNMAGSKPVYSPEAARFLPTTDLPDDVMVTGGMVGDGSIEELIAHGSAVGAEAAVRALRVGARWQGLSPSAPDPAPITATAGPIPELATGDHLELYRSSTHGYVDYSEDIKSKDLVSAVKEGYHLMELNKRYTTVTMGPVQGKLEVGNAVAVHAEATGMTIAETGTTTWRPPYAPLTLGTLAGAHMDPVRYSPMQKWQEANGATPLVAGMWIRPEDYGDPVAEVNNVRNNVGIIDVTPLGKLELQGADVPKLLHFLYTNKWMKLPVGSVRYGVMCAEDGVVLDDGVVGHLDDDRYLMTTTTSGAGPVWHWMDFWLQTAFPDWDVTVTAVTDGWASINIAGHNSRELLSRITDIDLDPEAFGYMKVREGTVAGVDDCVVWRIGFTGELSYEVHVKAGYALTVWETILEEGKDLGVGPFGLEAQRILRLEKGHFIVGQDTDGLTKAYGAGIDWIIKLDKEDFAGKPELDWQSAAGGFPRLVAIQPVDPKIVPEEACQLVEGDTIVGRITSSRMSPTLNRSICFGFVAEHLAAPGSRVTARLVSGQLAPATVMEHHAHFDPEEGRLHG